MAPEADRDELDTPLGNTHLVAGVAAGSFAGLLLLFGLAWAVTLLLRAPDGARPPALVGQHPAAVPVVAQEKGAAEPVEGVEEDVAVGQPAQGQAGPPQAPPDLPGQAALPAAPKAGGAAGPPLPVDLSQVPEVALHEAPPPNIPPAQARADIARLIADVNTFNKQGEDGFLRALLRERADLGGLPFRMGAGCRQSDDAARHFGGAVQVVRQCLQFAPFGAANEADLFWTRYRRAVSRNEDLARRAGGACDEAVGRAHVAALTQMLAPSSPAVRAALARHLATVPDVEATRALARLAIYSPEADVRRDALKGLKLRRERDYTAVLVRGLRYPWPEVARHAAEAVVKLERTDLAPRLVAVLEASDPRAPVTKVVNGRPATVARELVRVNHHRNCLLCHSPASPGMLMPGAPMVATGGVPTPGEPLPSAASGYRNAGPGPDNLVRADVTYLRQDFSRLQPVANAHPWPAMQRFDFLVRTRVLTDREATAYREELARREAGGDTPYRQAARAALRELTGRDAGPTARAWRELLATNPPRLAAARE